MVPEFGSPEESWKEMEMETSGMGVYWGESLIRGKHLEIIDEFAAEMNVLVSISGAFEFAHSSRIIDDSNFRLEFVSPAAREYWLRFLPKRC